MRTGPVTEYPTAPEPISYANGASFTAGMNVKVIATILAIGCAIFLAWVFHEGSGESWTPYEFNYDARKEAVACLTPRCSRSEQKALTRWRRKEISTHDYETLAALAKHDMGLRPIIKEAMEDGEVTNEEWNFIIDANEREWDRFHKREGEAAKKSVLESL
jgi:hypothetical protein